MPPPVNCLVNDAKSCLDYVLPSQLAGCKCSFRVEPVKDNPDLEVAIFQVYNKEGVLVRETRSKEMPKGTLSGICKGAHVQVTKLKTVNLNTYFS